MGPSVCLAEATLAEFVAGGLQAEAIARVEQHLDSCHSCFRMLTEAARTSMGSGHAHAGHGDSDEVPRQIEEYCLLRRIGQGAMGQVFLAVDTRLDRPVAIKLLASVKRASARERFLVEARAVARLSHSNVVTIYRVGELGERPYLVYEYVRGISLDRATTPMPWPQALELALGLARGLAAAHAKGVLHRDIKPANAILGEDGTVKLLDFGLAKMVGAPDSLPPGEDLYASTPPAVALTTTGALLGTPLYMAPEAWAGALPSPAMDVYSLGAVVHELCTGTPAHRGLTLEELRKNVQLHGPRPLAEAAPGVHPELARVIDRCLLRAPADRPASAEALQRELEAIAASVEAPAPRPRSRRGRAFLLAGVVALLAAVTLLAVFRRAPSETKVATAVASASTPRASRPQTVCSPDKWCWEPTMPLAIRRGWAQAPDNVWIVGKGGMLRHFDGHAWSQVPSGTVADLHSVHGTAADDVWIVGAWGTLVHYDGVRWTPSQLWDKATLTDVLAIARDNVWVMGDKLIMHWDGKAWARVPIPVVVRLARLVARGPNDVWAVGDQGTVLHWDGKTWSRIDLGTDEFLTSITIVSADELWIAGFRGYVKRLKGKRWLDVELPLTPKHRTDFWITDVWSNGPDDIWLMSKREPYLHWDGKTWSFSDPKNPREYTTFTGTGKDDLWALTDTQVISHWDGTTWTTPTPPPPWRLHMATWAAATDDVWAVGYESAAPFDTPRHGSVQRFDGKTWKPLALPGTSTILRAVAGTRGDDVWIAGDGGYVAHWDGRELRRSDAGTSVKLYAVAALARDDVWVAGEHGTLLHWDGRAWRAAASGTDVTLAGLWADRKSGVVWAVGDKGTTLRHEGDAWVRVESGKEVLLTGVWGASADDVWACGQAGTMLHFVGSRWSAVPSDTNEDLVAISGTGPRDVWAVSFNTMSEYSSIVHWNGDYWSVLTHLPFLLYHGVWAVDPGDAWAVGFADAILRYQPVR